MSDNDYVSHAQDKLRTPIIKSLNDRMTIGKSNHNITGYNRKFALYGFSLTVLGL